MKKTITMVASALAATGALAAGPEIIYAYAINGRLSFQTQSNDFRLLQEKQDDEWVAVNEVFGNGGYYCGPDQSLRGEHVFRICGQNSDDWTEFTVDAGEPATGTLIYRGEASGGSYTAAYPIGNAFDGMPGSYFHASQVFASGEDQSLYMDMGESKYIGHVAVMRRLDYSNRIGNAIFEGANSPDFSDAVALYELAPGTTVDARLYSFDVEVPRKVRYLRLRPRGDGLADGWFNVAEVEFRVVAAPEGSVSMTLGDVGLQDGIVNSVELNLENFDADGFRIVVASGPCTIDSANPSSWPAVSEPGIATGTSVFSVPLPAGWGETVKSMRIFLISKSDGVIDSFTAPISCYGGDAPAFGELTVSDYQVGNDIVFAGTVDSIEGNPVSITLETSVAGDFSDAETWNVAYDSGSFSFVCHAGNADETDPVEFPANSAIKYRVRIIDGRGRETLSAEGQFTTGPYFCASPVLSCDAYAMCGTVFIPLPGIMSMSAVVVDTKDDFGQWRRVTGQFGTSGSYLYSLGNGWSGLHDFRIAYADSGEPTLWTGFSVNARYRVVGEPYYFGMSDGYYRSERYVVDNDLGSIFHSAHEIGYEGDDPSIYMDFGSETVIAQAAIYYGGYGAGRIGHVVFEAADDREFTTNVRELHTLTDAELWTGAPMAVCSFEPTAVRYVRARPQAGSPFDGWFNVGELEFGFDPTTANLSVSVEDSSLPDCWPTLRFSRGFNPGNKVAVFRSTKEDGGYRKIVEVNAESTAWTDETVPLAKRVWYRLAKVDANGVVGALDDGSVSFTRGRLLPLDSASVGRFIMNAPGEYANVPSVVFTGSETPNGYISVAPGRQGGGWDMYDPLIGIDYRAYKPVHVTMCRFYPQTAGYHMRMNGVQVFGSNDADAYQSALADDPKTNGWNFIKASTAISEGFSVPTAKWYNYVCDDTAAYDFVYLGYREDRGMDVGWLGDADEIRFYGYADDEIPLDGLTIIVR